jgi:hypothetical protein
MLPMSRQPFRDRLGFLVLVFSVFATSNLPFNSAFADPESPTAPQESTRNETLDLKSFAIKWEGNHAVRLIRIPLISTLTMAENYALGKLPFLATGITKTSVIEIRKILSLQEVQLLNLSDWDPNTEIERHLNKNPFNNDTALERLEVGEEIRFEMHSGGSVGLKTGSFIPAVPLGFSATKGTGQRFVFTLKKLSGNQVNVDVTRIGLSTKATQASLGPGLAFVADSSAGQEKNTTFRDFISKIYMNLTQNTESHGTTLSLVLDLNRPEHSRFLVDGIIGGVRKNKQGSVKSADDLHAISTEFWSSIEDAISKFHIRPDLDRTELVGNSFSLDRSAGMTSLIGKFLYSYKFSRNFVHIEETLAGQKTPIAAIQYYQAEAALIGAKRGLGEKKNIKSSSMQVVFSTQGPFANPVVDQFLELSIHSDRMSYGKGNSSDLNQWQEHFVDILPTTLYEKVFSNAWSGDSLEALRDPKITINAFFNRDYLLGVARAAQQAGESAEAYFEKRLTTYIEKANSTYSLTRSTRDAISEYIYQFFVTRFGRENEGQIDLKGTGIRKDIKNIAQTLAAVIDVNSDSLKRIQAFESLRNIALYKRISLGFMLNLVDVEGFERTVRLEIERTSTTGDFKPQYDLFTFGAERHPNLVKLQYLMNRARGDRTTFGTANSNAQMTTPEFGTIQCRQALTK